MTCSWCAKRETEGGSVLCRACRLGTRPPEPARAPLAEWQLVEGLPGYLTHPGFPGWLRDAAGAWFSRRDVVRAFREAEEAAEKVEAAEAWTRFRARLRQRAAS